MSARATAGCSGAVTKSSRGCSTWTSSGLRFRIADTPLDEDVLWRLADEVRQQLPVLLEATPREHRGGIPTMTADGQYMLGPAPGARGFFIASGCNVAGLSVSPAIGEALAAWIVDGEPPLDLDAALDTRFASSAGPRQERLEREAAWQYRHFYGAVRLPCRR